MKGREGALSMAFCICTPLMTSWIVTRNLRRTSAGKVPDEKRRSTNCAVAFSCAVSTAGARWAARLKRLPDELELGVVALHSQARINELGLHGTTLDLRDSRAREQLECEGANRVVLARERRPRETRGKAAP